LSIATSKDYGGENFLIGGLNFYPIIIPFFGCQVSGVSVQPSRRSKKRPVKSKKKHNSSPQRTLRTPRKKILNKLCDLRDLCGEIFLENGIGYYEVSYKDMLLHLPFLTPETKFAEQKRFKKLSLYA
jgi:hypothetical protein